MADRDYHLYRYSITCATDDAAIVSCLRALCQHCERGKYPQIGWGGTGMDEWIESGNQITLRFTSPLYRQDFEHTAGRLLPPGSWQIVDRNDDDPASRQRSSSSRFGT